MGPQVLSFKWRPFLRAAIWRTHRPVSVTTGCTRIAPLFVNRAPEVDEVALVASIMNLFTLASRVSS